VRNFIEKCEKISEKRKSKRKGIIGSCDGSGALE
jgi:hypothetical protein